MNLLEYLRDVSDSAVAGRVAMAVDSRQLQKFRVFVSLAEGLAKVSTCRRLLVGCVVVPADLSMVYSIGYNGPPAGEPNDSCSGEEGRCGCVHAEANALVKLSTTDEECLLITSRAPCRHCAGLIVNCKKVAAVVYADGYRDDSGLDLLLRAGMAVVKLERSRCDRI